MIMDGVMRPRNKSEILWLSIGKSFLLKQLMFVAQTSTMVRVQLTLYHGFWVTIPIPITTSISQEKL